MLRRRLRLILTTTGILGGLVLTVFSLEQLQGSLGLSDEFKTAGTALILLLGSLLGGTIGFIAAPVVLWAETRLAKTPLVDLLAGAAGLIVGLIIAGLFASTIRTIPWFGSMIAVLSALVCGYLGMAIAARKREEMAGALGQWSRSLRERRVLGKNQGESGDVMVTPKILDTSVIIDGRIADIVCTGFLEGPIVIPNFVLEELRHIADSSDVLKRNRGRRGLDILNRIQKEAANRVQIYEEEMGEGLEVDSQLLRLGKRLGGMVVTNDYNLNKVAELQGVPVLNINELANAVKPAVLPGEEMLVTVIKEGKEAGQGVAYLDDGTMIVVDGGRKHIGQNLAVLVTSVLQTAAGRMIFAKPKSQHGRERAAQ